MESHEIGGILLQNLVWILIVMTALWGVAVRLKDVSFIDAVWPLAMLFLALITWPRVDGDPLRQGLLLGLVAVWALRLGLHLFLRWRRQGADGRYVDLVEAQKRKRGWSFNRTALVFVFWPQAAFAWLTALPVQLGQIGDAPVGVLAWIGVGLAVIGIAFETIGDAQLAAFKRDPANKGKVLAAGLWRYTRHPNYFGDACVWWGLWLIAAEAGWQGVAAIAGPLFLTFTLTRWSGVTLTEKAIHKSRPGYAEYVARTSAFVPMPPKRGVGG